MPQKKQILDTQITDNDKIAALCRFRNLSIKSIANMFEDNVKLQTTMPLTEYSDPFDSLVGGLSF